MSAAKKKRLRSDKNINEMKKRNAKRTKNPKATKRIIGIISLCSESARKKKKMEKEVKITTGKRRHLLTLSVPT